MQYTIRKTSRITSTEHAEELPRRPEEGLKRDVRDMLREIAYVLHATRKIKAEILAK